MRIFPEIVQRMVLPFSSSTLNMALGSGSTTVPSSSIASCLLNLLHLSLLMTEQLDSVPYGSATVHDAWKTHRPRPWSEGVRRLEEAEGVCAVRGAVPEGRCGGLCALEGPFRRGFARWRRRTVRKALPGRGPQCARSPVSRIAVRKAPPKRGPQCAQPGRAHWRAAAEGPCALEGSHIIAPHGASGRHVTQRSPLRARPGTALADNREKDCAQPVSLHAVSEVLSDASSRKRPLLATT